MSVYDCDSADLLDFAEQYASLGEAVQSQLKDILDGSEQSMCGVNPNAVDLIKERLRGYNGEIDSALHAYSDWRHGNLIRQHEERENE